jgi:putative tricarboxylic transport membrane protein
MLKKKIAALAGLALAASMVATPVAHAAAKPANKAVVGDECLRAGVKAPGRGVNGSDLTCTKVTTGSFAG